MSELGQVQTLEVPLRTNEYLGVRLAGPETAAELGVPVGTPIEARHVVQPLEIAADEETAERLGVPVGTPLAVIGLPAVARVVSVEEAEEIQARIDLEAGPVNPTSDEE